MNVHEWLEELELLRKAATPGPWSVSKQGTNETFHHRIERYYEDKEVSDHIAYVGTNIFGSSYDAAYIVAACNAVPRLVEMVKFISEKASWPILNANGELIEERTPDDMMEMAYNLTEPKE